MAGGTSAINLNFSTTKTVQALSFEVYVLPFPDNKNFPLPPKTKIPIRNCFRDRGLLGWEFMFMCDSRGTGVFCAHSLVL
jgi:hypothetical protein